MKWIRRLLLVFLVFVVIAIIASTMGYRRMHGLPDWYAPRVADPTAQAAAANRATQKLIQTNRDAVRLQIASRHPEAEAINAARGASAGLNHSELTLTEEEANACFNSWDLIGHWNRQYSRYLSDPEIVFHEHHIILAATSVDLQTLVSVEFAPELKDGMLRLPVVRVMAGSLPLPRAFWDGYRTRLIAAVQRQLPATVRAAKLNDDGTANPELVNAVLGRLLCQILDDQPGEAILFFPSVQSSKKSLPVRLTDVSIDDDAIHLSFIPLSEAERQTMAASIKQPVQTSSAADPGASSP